MEIFATRNGNTRLFINEGNERCQKPNLENEENRLPWELFEIPQSSTKYTYICT